MDCFDVHIIYKTQHATQPEQNFNLTKTVIFAAICPGISMIFEIKSLILEKNQKHCEFDHPKGSVRPICSTQAFYREDQQESVRT